MTTTTMPAAGTDPESMSLEAVLAELQRYKPGTAFAVVRTEEYMARRVKLWARLDQLSGVRKPAIAKAVTG
jgi:hypothetical protein